MAQKDDLMTNAALIVAAGRGSRMRQDMPKQYLSLIRCRRFWPRIGSTRCGW